MKPRVVLLSSFAFLGMMVVSTFEVGAEVRVVGGVTPDRRPEGSPTLSSFDLDRKRALHGISKPYPTSIEHWLDDQGAWFTPFNHPGMSHPYDIRNWHGKSDG
ncbi:MAG TPA: hypothetical protein P5114_00085 [Hyphomicrobiaceae bacterium]|nr:hypothetical protein [Hyphomicrobiaceae bacterium]